MLLFISWWADAASGEDVNGERVDDNAHRDDESATMATTMQADDDDDDDDDDDHDHDHDHDDDDYDGDDDNAGEPDDYYDEGYVCCDY